MKVTNDNPNYLIAEDDEWKIFRSKEISWNFNKINGYTATWGETKEDDPDYSPYGPILADVEISEVCSGVEGVGVCKFCYKSNTPNGRNMSLETFKKIFHKLPPTMTQIAMGIGDLDGNPDMKAIFEYSRANNIVPNVTINGEGLTDDWADWLSQVCGAVAVSVYDKEKTFDCVKKLTDRGMTQVNLHRFVAEETFNECMELIDDIKSEPRLEKLNAIVFLSLKPKGRAIQNNYTQLSQSKFTELIEYAVTSGINWGCDSCSAFKVLKACENSDIYETVRDCVTSCESTMESSYINTAGEFYPCSFMEKENDWKTGIDVVNCNDFVEDVWMNIRTIRFRNRVLGCRKICRSCPHFEV